MLSTRSVPSISRLPRTNLDHDFHHSTAISVLRGLAAVQVVAAHLRAQLYPSLKSLPDPSLWYQAFAFATGFAHQAVVIFFLLSGWLVGGNFLNKLHDRHVLMAYGIDRISRLWIVLIPAFFLTLLLAAMTGAVDPSTADLSPANEYSIVVFIGNLFGLQDILVPRYGGNFALWSLTNETWYYALFPIMLTPLLTRSKLAWAVTAAAGAALLALLTFPILLFFVVWLMGVGASRIKIEATLLARLLLFAGFVGLAIFFRLTGSNDKLEPESFVQDVILSTAFLALLCSLQFRVTSAGPVYRIVKKAGATLAAFSFTLYVIHVPIILAARDLFNLSEGGRFSADSPGDFGIYLVLLFLIVIFAYLFHLPFEAQTDRVRNRLKALLLGANTAPPAFQVMEPAPVSQPGPLVSLFESVILPMSGGRQVASEETFPPNCGNGRQSHYVRCARTTDRAEFTAGACANPDEFEQRMAAHWRSLGRDELANEISRFGEAARKSLASERRG